MLDTMGLAAMGWKYRVAAGRSLCWALPGNKISRPFYSILQDFHL